MFISHDCCDWETLVKEQEMWIVFYFPYVNIAPMSKKRKLMQVNILLLRGSPCIFFSDKFRRPSSCLTLASVIVAALCSAKMKLLLWCWFSFHTSIICFLSLLAFLQTTVAKFRDCRIALQVRHWHYSVWQGPLWASCINVIFSTFINNVAI